MSLQNAENIVMLLGVLLGPGSNFCFGLLAATTAWFANKNQTGDLASLQAGTNWYGSFGAKNQLIIGFA